MQLINTAVAHRSIEIEGLEIAYREAGDPARPTVLLLHGFPTSSQMFDELIPALAVHYHVLAPDYPGYGASEMPSREEFDYSFANLAGIVEQFVEAKEVDSFSLYLMDYGAPVGFRLFAKHPEKVNGFIIQNGNAYEEGLREFWDPIKAYWASGSEEHREALRGLLTIDATKWQYTHGVGDVSTISPDNWHTDQFLLDREGNKDIQLDLFASYATNVTEYSKWQALFRKHQPPAIVLWGKNDQIFPAEGAHPYKRDLKNLEFHLLDTGHFALEEYGPMMAQEILDFLDRETPQG
ncbi:MAG: alpha/beta hydrolase [Sphingomonadaceae bacterium]|nr:alpha/beta hydrolase [Sphingomonadaceae bacterium]